MKEFFILLIIAIYAKTAYSLPPIPVAPKPPKFPTFEPVPNWGVRVINYDFNPAEIAGTAPDLPKGSKDELFFKLLYIPLTSKELVKKYGLDIDLYDELMSEMDAVAKREVDKACPDGINICTIDFQDIFKVMLDEVNFVDRLKVLVGDLKSEYADQLLSYKTRWELSFSRRMRVTGNPIFSSVGCDPTIRLSELIEAQSKHRRPY